MKNPSLEAKISKIESAEKQRRVRAAVLISKQQKQQSGSRKAVIRRMIQRAKWET
ncbi:hypothetical protein BD311DRAFT_604617, partial [Dichomitus squalens]